LTRSRRGSQHNRFNAQRGCEREGDRGCFAEDLKLNLIPRPQLMGGRNQLNGEVMVEDGRTVESDHGGYALSWYDTGKENDE
jgi:hypothetical protein